MTETNGRVEILRAAGFGEAADLLERLNVIDAARATHANEPEQPRPVTERRHSAAEVQRQREGEALMAALRESIPGIFDRDR